MKIWWFDFFHSNLLVTSNYIKRLLLISLKQNYKSWRWRSLTARNITLPLPSDPVLMRIILEPFGDVIRFSPANPGPRCIDRGETGGERPIGERELEGADGCLDPASRTIGMPGIIGSCDGPARPGDLSFGDVTSLESKDKKNLLSQPLGKHSHKQSVMIKFKTGIHNMQQWQKNIFISRTRKTCSEHVLCRQVAAWTRITRHALHKFNVASTCISHISPTNFVIYFTRLENRVSGIYIVVNGYSRVMQEWLAFSDHKVTKYCTSSYNQLYLSSFVLSSSLPLVSLFFSLQSRPSLGHC